MLLQDLRFALRVFRKNIGPSGLATLALALAVGAATSLSSVVYGVLFKPLPFQHPERLVAVWEVTGRGAYARLADPNFDDFRDQSRSFVSLAKYADWVTAVAGGSEPTLSRVAAVSRSFFELLGVAPRLGRGFLPADAHPGAEPVVVASDGYWRRSLGSSPDLRPQKIRIDDRVYSVVGVMPAGFQFPAGVELWRPAELDSRNESRTAHNFQAIGRLRDGVSVAEANADLRRIARGIVGSSSEGSDYLLKDAAAVPLWASLTGHVASPLYVLLGAVGFLLLVACANVAHLLLSQAAARAREIAVRRALGAGRGRLVRQFVAEALVLAITACALGLVIAAVGLRILLALAPPDIPRLDQVSMSWPVLAFAGAVSVTVAVALGLFVAVRSTAFGQEAPLEASRGEAGSARSRAAGRFLIAGQLATTLVLLVGAGLLGRSLLQALSVDPGFRTEGVVTLDLSLPYANDPAAKARLSQFLDSVLERLGSLPEADAVGVVSSAPMDKGRPDGMFVLMAPSEMPRRIEDLEGLFAQKERQGNADFCVASEGYFRALGIPAPARPPVRRVRRVRGAPRGPPERVARANALPRPRSPGPDPPVREHGRRPAAPHRGGDRGRHPRIRP
jgi:predicted permease